MGKEPQLISHDHRIVIDGNREVQFDLCVCCTGTTKLSIPLNSEPIEEAFGQNCLLRGMLDPAHPKILLQHPFPFSPSVKMAWLNAQWIAKYISRQQVLDPEEALGYWHWYWEGREIGNMSGPASIDGWWPRINSLFSRQVKDDLSKWAPEALQLYEADCEAMDLQAPSAEEMTRFDSMVYQHLVETPCDDAN